RPWQLTSPGGIQEARTVCTYEYRPDKHNARLASRRLLPGGMGPPEDRRLLRESAGDNPGPATLVAPGVPTSTMRHARRLPTPCWGTRLPCRSAASGTPGGNSP